MKKYRECAVMVRFLLCASLEVIQDCIGEAVRVMLGHNYFTKDLSSSDLSDMSIKFKKKIDLYCVEIRFKTPVRKYKRISNKEVWKIDNGLITDDKYMEWKDC